MECIDGWMPGWMDGWMDRWIDGWMDGWMDRWIDRWIDRVTKTEGDLPILLVLTLWEPCLIPHTSHPSEPQVETSCVLRGLAAAANENYGQSSNSPLLSHPSRDERAFGVYWLTPDGTLFRS
jgi:hypothetical protein